MLSKRPSPMIGKLSELLLSGGSTRSAASELATSPRSPLDLKMVQSPRALNKYDAGGVGLGIVAALEKSSKAKYAICSQSLCRSNPIPARSNCGEKCARFEETESLEDYTIVTTHGPNRSFTKVYYAGVQFENSNYDHFIDSKQKSYDQSDLYPTSSFLSSCNLCRKDLHGKDIYMYRGEKAFCSTECRSKQMMMDERKEHCRSDASRSVDVSSSPYSRGQIFSTGIAAV